jgi:hypothetical protein
MIWAIIIGAAVILWPMLLLKLKDQPYFRMGGDASPRKLAKRRR